MNTIKQTTNNVPFRFYLSEGKDGDLVDKLQGMPSYMKNELVRDALRQFVVNYADYIKNSGTGAEAIEKAEYTPKLLRKKMSCFLSVGYPRKRGV